MPSFYDLFVLLDPEASEERRAAIVDQVKRQIDAGSGASLRGDADWGMRRLSYEIDHRREAQYHLFQFEGTPEVLTQLHRALTIDDSVLRHRIIRLPALPDSTPKAPEEPPRRAGDERAAPRDRREHDDAPYGEAADQPAAESVTEAPPSQETEAEESPPAAGEPAANGGPEGPEQTRDDAA